MRNVLKVLSISLLLGTPAVALAGPSATGYGASNVAGNEVNWFKPAPPRPRPSPRPVPELSVGGAGAAIALLAGAVMMMSERRRRGQSK